MLMLSLIPTVFLPLSLLSYTSILGIISTILLVIVILIDGFSKKEAPGSFWDPAETSFAIASVEKLGAAFGLFMAGVSNLFVKYAMFITITPSFLVMWSSLLLLET